MATLITCPNCKNEFAPEHAIAKVLEKEFETKLNQEREALIKQYSLQKHELEKQQKEFDEKKKKENDLFAEKLQKEKLKLEAELHDQLRKTLSADYENQLRLLQDTAAEKDVKLKEARRKELEFLQKEKQLLDKEAELQLQLQRQLLSERSKLKEQLQKEEQEKMNLKEQEYQLRMREMEKQIEDQKKLVDEMKRKAEQGSMQLQGEVQELLLENILHHTFPFDKIVPVGKGVRGADCIQTICNPYGNECGKIIYESKRTNAFSSEWIGKLKQDMRNKGADIAVIVTQTLPKDMQRFGEKEGVYICTFAEVRSLATVLRLSILKAFQITKSQENKGDKMHMLYDYLTGNEFNEQWKAIREGFLSMKMSIQRERDAMERLWKAREKQLEKVLLGAAHIRGSVEGIAGVDAIDLNLLEDNDEGLLE